MTEPDGKPFITECASCRILAIAYPTDVADPLCGPCAQREVQSLAEEWLATSARLDELCDRAEKAGNACVEVEMVRAALWHEPREEGFLDTGAVIEKIAKSREAL